MSISIKWFPHSWFQIKAGKRILYIDPAYLKTYFAHYPQRIEFSSWPDPIDGLPKELEQERVGASRYHPANASSQGPLQGGHSQQTQARRHLDRRSQGLHQGIG